MDLLRHSGFLQPERQRGTPILAVYLFFCISMCVPAWFGAQVILCSHESLSACACVCVCVLVHSRFLLSSEELKKRAEEED